MNRHPVDRLHDLKVQIAELELEHNQLRALILAGAVEPVGVEWFAHVDERQKRFVYVSEAERLLPATLFAEVVHTVQQPTVTLRPISRAKPARAAKPWNGYRRGNRKVRLGK